MLCFHDCGGCFSNALYTFHMRSPFVKLCVLLTGHTSYILTFISFLTCDVCESDMELETKFFAEGKLVQNTENLLDFDREN